MSSAARRLLVPLVLLVVASVATPGVAATHGRDSTSGLRATAGRTLLGKWTTRFTPSDWNGWGANIRVPAQRIDGTIVRPGGTISFLREAGPYTNPPYRMGAALRSGRIRNDRVLGGGMCSSVVTLFNAAARAGLKIIERHEHSLYISRYPVGLDATVFGSPSRGQDLVFRNDMPHAILIRGIARRRSVTFEIWGIDVGRTVKFSEPMVTGEVQARRYLEYTNDLAPGERRLVNDPYDGFRAVVSRTVRNAKGAIVHLDTFRSRYRLLHGLTQVGRYKGDPPAGTRILAKDYPH